MSTATAFSRPMTHERSPHDTRSVVAELDNIFRLNSFPGQAKPQPSSSDPRRVSQADLDAALEMLGRAGKAMDILQTRYHQVEHYARDVADRAERDLATAYGHAKDWEARAAGTESKLDEMKTRVAEAERRLEQAERRAHLADVRAEAAERGAREAREWLECFYEKIVASFDTRPTLKSVTA